MRGKSKISVKNISEIKCSFWENMKKVNDVTEISIGHAIERMQSDEFKRRIIKIRKLRKEDESNDVRNHAGNLQYVLSKPEKEKLPAIIPSGIFTSRSKKGLVEYKNIMAVDYDHIPKKKVEALRIDLMENQHVYTVFISPSGEGLKVLVPIKGNEDTHRKTYLQWGKDFPNEYWDKNVHDYSRLMFLSWDPTAQINENAIQYEYTKPKEEAKPKTSKTRRQKAKSFDARDMYSVLEHVIPQLPAKYADGRISWISGLNAIISEFGEGGRPLAHAFSSLSSKYTYEETDKKFDSESATNTPGGSSIKTFAYWARESSVPFFSGTEWMLKEGKTIKEVSDEVGIPEEDVRQIKEGMKQQIKSPVVAIEFIKDHFDLGTNIITGQVLDKTAGKVVNPNDMFVVLMEAGYEVNVSQVNAMCRSTIIAPEYDPFKEYFNSLKDVKVDGHKNIENLANMIILENENQREFFNVMFRKHLIRAVGAAMDASINRIMLVLSDGLSSKGQSMGKSTLFRWLGGSDVKKESIHPLNEYYSEQPIVIGKDTELSLTETFLYNIEELEAMSPKELANFKQILSKGKSRIRRPYAANHEMLSRRCTFFSSTNQTEFLTDDRNTRYLVFNISGMNWDYQEGENKIDVNDLWAEAYHMWSRDVCSGDLSSSDFDMQDAMNDTHKIGDPMDDYLESLFHDDGDEFEIPALPLIQALKNLRLYKSNQQMGRIISSMPNQIQKKKHPKTRRSVYVLKSTHARVEQIFVDAKMENRNPYKLPDAGQAPMEMNQAQQYKPNF